MSLIQDEQLVQAFLPNRAHPALGHGIGFRCSKGRPNHFKAFRGEDLVEATRKFTIAVMNEEAQGSLGAVIQLPDELARLLRDPSSIRIGGAARKVDTTRAEFDEEEHIERFQPNRFDSEKVAGQHLLPIVFQKGAP
jgi:hypothetical protein